MARNITNLQGGQHAENAGEQEFIQIVRLSTDTLPGTTDDNTLYMTPSTISNSVEISNATWNSTANIANSGTSRQLTITGDEGAVALIEYSTGASGSRTVTIPASGSTTVSVTIAAQAAGAAQRTITATITPGTSDPETVIAGGENSIVTDGITQLAGRAIVLSDLISFTSVGTRTYTAPAAPSSRTDTSTRSFTWSIPNGQRYTVQGVVAASSNYTGATRIGRQNPGENWGSLSVVNGQVTNFGDLRLQWGNVSSGGEAWLGITFTVAGISGSVTVRGMQVNFT